MIKKNELLEHSKQIAKETYDKLRGYCSDLINGRFAQRMAFRRWLESVDMESKVISKEELRRNQIIKLEEEAEKRKKESEDNKGGWSFGFSSKKKEEEEKENLELEKLEALKIQEASKPKELTIYEKIIKTSIISDKEKQKNAASDFMTDYLNQLHSKPRLLNPNRVKYLSNNIATMRECHILDDYEKKLKDEELQNLVLLSIEADDNDDDNDDDNSISIENNK
jgi:hypothetical protein